MKKFYAILCLAIASLTQLQAQAPQGFNYQATVRNSSGDLIVNTNVYNFYFWMSLTDLLCYSHAKIRAINSN